MIRRKLTMCAIGFTCFLASCTDSSRYVESLPADAAMVSSVDLAEIVEKAGLSDVANSSLRTLWKRALGQDLGASEALLDKMLENPSESGLYLTDKLYIFLASESEYAGALFRVADRSKLEKLIETLHTQQLCEPVREATSSSWTVMGRFLAAWSDDAFLVVTSPRGDDASGLLRQADRLLRQQEEESFVATADYTRLSESKGDVVTMASMNILPYQMVLPFTMGVSGDLNLKDIKAFSTLIFDEGKAVMDIETAVSDKVMQTLLDKQLQATAPLHGTYLDCFPKNTGSWFSFRADGGKLYALLNEHPNIRRRFQHSMIPLDFESIFNAIEGDVVFSMPNPFGSRAFIAYAEVSEVSFLQTLEDLKPMLAMTGGQAVLENMGETAYVFRTTDASLVGLPSGPMVLWMGVENGHLYVTNDRQLLDNKVLGLSLRNTEWGARTSGQRFMLAGSLEGLWKGGEYLTVESADGKHIHIECTAKDKKVNILRQLTVLLGIH